jgi:hypothetical protein
VIDCSIAWRNFVRWGNPNCSDEKFDRAALQEAYAHIKLCRACLLRIGRVKAFKKLQAERGDVWKFIEPIIGGTIDVFSAEKSLDTPIGPYLTVGILMKLNKVKRLKIASFFFDKMTIGDLIAWWLAPPAPRASERWIPLSKAR